MNLRRLASTIAFWVDSPIAKQHIYRRLVAEVAEPGALKELEGIDSVLDWEIEWCGLFPDSERDLLGRPS